MVEEDKPAAPAPAAPVTRKLTGKRKTATLDLPVPEGYEVERSWQVRDVSKLKENLEAEVRKKNEVFVITVRGARKSGD